MSTTTASTRRAVEPAPVRKSTTVRIRAETHEKLAEVAGLLDESLQDVLDQAVDEFRTRIFFELHDAAYQAIRSDAEAWMAELEERAEWETASADGLEPE